MYRKTDILTMMHAGQILEAIGLLLNYLAHVYFHMISGEINSRYKIFKIFQVPKHIIIKFLFFADASSRYKMNE